jgi:hypothetical protein
MSLDTPSNVGTLNTIWLDSSQYVTLAELMQLSGFSEQDIREFVDIGVLTPAVSSAAEPQFSATYVMSVRKAGQLKTELDLDLNALVVVLTLLEQIRGMECDMSKLRARLPEYRRA